MGKCVIFCAGGFDGLLLPLEEDDHIIAADGGWKHTQTLGIAPHTLLGDFDSLGFIPAGAEVFPVEKDDTDAMLAVRRGLALGYREFMLYGALDGPRLDHTIANFQTLLFLTMQGGWGYLIGRDYIVTVVQRQRLCFPATATGVLSLFCLDEPARGITLRGLHYPLEKGSLTAHHPLGVSNHFEGDAAFVAVEEGCLLAMWDRKNGLPEREAL